MSLNSVPVIVSFVCGFLLLSITFALIFSNNFRKDVLGGSPGEATIFNILTIKGVVIVLLSGLFLGGFIYPLKYIGAHIDEPDISSQSGRLRNGELCTKDSECDSQQCYPGPATESPSSHPWYCISMDRNCALPKLDGADYKTVVYQNGAKLMCENPQNGKHAQFMSLWRLP